MTEEEMPLLIATESMQLQAKSYSMTVVHAHAVEAHHHETKEKFKQHEAAHEHATIGTSTDKPLACFPTS